MRSWIWRHSRGSGGTDAEKNGLFAAGVLAYPPGMKAIVSVVSVSTFTWLPVAADERAGYAAGYEARAQQAMAAYPDSQEKRKATTR